LPQHLSKVVGLSSLRGLVTSFWSTGSDVPVLHTLIPEVACQVGQWNLAQLTLVGKHKDVLTAVGILPFILAGDSTSEASRLELGLNGLGNISIQNEWFVACMSLSSGVMAAKGPLIVAIVVTSSEAVSTDVLLYLLN
jgi:hypothetical protein